MLSIQVLPIAQTSSDKSKAACRALIASISDDQRRGDAETLLPFFSQITGYDPTVWSGSIIGFGRYDYTYASGHSGRSFATGFSPRKAAMSVYIMPGYQDFSDILARLGKHKMAKSCLYIKRLDQINLDVLGELVQAGLRDLSRQYQIHPS